MSLLNTIIENIQHKALAKRPPVLLIVNKATYNILRMEAWQEYHTVENKERLADSLYGVKIRVLEDGEYILV